MRRSAFVTHRCGSKGARTRSKLLSSPQMLRPWLTDSIRYTSATQRSTCCFVDGIVQKIPSTMQQNKRTHTMLIAFSIADQAS